MLLLFIAQTIAQMEPNTNLFKDYGFPGLLILLMIFMFKYFISEASKQSEKREKEIMRENEIREKAYQSSIDQMQKLVETVSRDWRETNFKLDRNYQDAINKFVQVIKEQAEQNNYSVQVLTELKEKIEELSKKKHLSFTDFESFKTDILNIFQKIGIEYNLPKKG